MDSSAAMIRVLGSHARSFDEAEPLVGAMGAELPKGDKVLDPIRMAGESNFPLTNKMMLALTPRRLIVYKTGWGSKVGASIGEVDQARIADIQITWNRKLAVVAFALSDAPIVVMRATEPDDAEHFRNRFLKMRGRI